MEHLDRQEDSVYDPPDGETWRLGDLIKLTLDNEVNYLEGDPGDEIAD